MDEPRLRIPVQRLHLCPLPSALRSLHLCPRISALCPLRGLVCAAVARPL